MRQFITIAQNAFLELVGQPVFLLLMSTSAAFAVFLSGVPYFGFGDDAKMVTDTVMAVMLLSGLLGAVLSASSSVAHEIQTGTALAVLAKPVGRARFLLGKFAGLVAGLTLLTYVNLLALLLASRMAFDAYGDADLLGLGIFYGGMALAYALGGFTNYFLRRSFVSDATLALVVFSTAAFVLINFLGKDGQWQTFAKGVDWRLVRAGVLILFAIWILTALALMCSTRLDTIPTLAVCSALFLLGLMSDYLFGTRAEHGVWWASVLYSLAPNWQHFWMASALEPGRDGIPMAYIAQALGYMAAYVAATLCLALAMFDDRELS